MSAIRSSHGTPLAWNLTLDEPDKERETRPVEFAAFFTFGFPVVLLPAVGLPVNEVGPMLLVAISLTRTGFAPHRVQVPAWFVSGLVLLLGLLAVASYENGLTPIRRLLHVTLYIFLSVFIANGRIHLPSAAKGMTMGLCSSILLSLAGFGPNHYQGRLTGMLGDPNAGGYVVIVIGLVALGLGARGRWRSLLLLLLPVTVVLTYSRTTLLALAFSITWLVVGRRLSLVTGTLLAGLMVYIVGHIPAQLRLFGPFSDRGGSDLLRLRIIGQEHTDVATSPLWGSGGGTAHVNLAGDQFFYHSSYLALQREGGLVSVVVLVSVIVVAFLAMLRLPRTQRNVWLEASLIALMVCSVNIGEALLELPAAVAIGFCVNHLVTKRAERVATPHVATRGQERAVTASTRRVATRSHVRRRAV